MGVSVGAGGRVSVGITGAGVFVAAGGLVAGGLGGGCL